ncbi:Uncharacterised protein [Mycobacteroides abscessus subsp. abscessus]|nr:Uncharacterised protein [Mycobacteroides abscessus subsp. abscessus]
MSTSADNRSGDPCRPENVHSKGWPVTPHSRRNSAVERPCAAVIGARPLSSDACVAGGSTTARAVACRTHVDVSDAERDEIDTTSPAATTWTSRGRSRAIG